MCVQLHMCMLFSGGGITDWRTTTRCARVTASSGSLPGTTSTRWASINRSIFIHNNSPSRSWCYIFYITSITQYSIVLFRWLINASNLLYTCILPSRIFYANSYLWEYHCFVKYERREIWTCISLHRLLTPSKISTRRPEMAPETDWTMWTCSRAGCWRRRRTDPGSCSTGSCLTSSCACVTGTGSGTRTRNTGMHHGGKVD